MSILVMVLSLPSPPLFSDIYTNLTKFIDVNNDILYKEPIFSIRTTCIDSLLKVKIFTTLL